MNVWEIGSWLGWALLHSLWQGAAIAAALGIALCILRSPSTRHLTCLVAMAALPLATLSTLALTAERKTSAPLDNSTFATRASSLPPPPALAVPAPEMAAGNFEPPPSRRAVPFPAAAQTSAWPSLFAAIWLAGVLGLSIRHAAACARLRELRRSAAPPEELVRQMFIGLQRRLGLAGRSVELLVSENHLGPMLVGTFKPAVILPMHVLTGLPGEEIEALLAHELAHFARRDHWSNLVRVTIGTLYYYHPAVWWMEHCLRREREHAADDFVLQAGSPRKVYASALAHLAELESLGIAANSGRLLARIERILNLQPSGRTSAAPLVPATAAAMAALAILVVTAVGEETQVLDVKPSESIQAAIDRAPEGSIVKIPAGTFSEHITITKSLSIEGVGAGKTILSVREPDPEDLRKSAVEADLHRAAAVSAEEKTAADLEFVKLVRRPAILVAHAKSVSIRGLTVQGDATDNPDAGGAPSTLVYFFASDARVENCTVAGPFGYGIMIAHGADVQITRTLVANFRSTGVAVFGSSGKEDPPPGRLRLSDSEVRNGYHRCITIGPGCDDTVIERCRISGSAWHGIRYDNASPTITGNTIYRNARSGIYASGKTRATVTENLFWANEMSGISCWFDNTDVIEKNTFVGNLREGMGALSSKPSVNQNIFAGNPVAVIAGGIHGKSLPIGDPSLGKNLFWENKVAVQIGGEQKPAPEGSLQEDPKFVNPGALDFTLAEDSPARRAGMGAASPLSPVSPWPPLAGEKAITAADGTRATEPETKSSDKTSAPSQQHSAKIAAQWVEDAFQLDDAEKRDAAIDSILAALNSNDPAKVRVGLAAFRRVGAVEFDRERFRPPLRRLLKSEDGHLRAEACGALASTGASEENLDLVLAMVDDPDDEVQGALPFAIKWLSPHGFTGRAGEAILKLLDRFEGNVPRGFWGVMWGTETSPELEKRIVEASREFAGYSEVFYYALTVHQSKREPTVTRLIELASDQDTVNVGQRVLWGIRQGLAEDQKPRVAELALKVLDSRSEGSMRNEAIECLRQTGTAANVPALDELLSKPGVTGEFRRTLEEVRSTLESRKS